MSLTATILLIYAACLVGTIASSRSSQDNPSEGQGPRRLLGALLVPTLALVGAGMVAGSPARAAEPVSHSVSQGVGGPAHVIDGATLEIGGRRLRLHGIDAPEIDQTCYDGHERGYACGRVAAAALAARIGAAPLACEPRGGADGTATVLCRLGEEDLAAWMVANGYAVADRSVSADYTDQDRRAWGRRLGLWSGVFELPSERRRLRGANAGL
ncbi:MULTISPECIES: thermonuclease family protein [unclassified Methylobacterium]|uniref:thermonuclease family protein n=2 Tax=Bacteria TaxID=2 RepID=UPI0036F99E35